MMMVWKIALVENVSFPLKIPSEMEVASHHLHHLRIVYTVYTFFIVYTKSFETIHICMSIHIDRYGYSFTVGSEPSSE